MQMVLRCLRQAAEPIAGSVSGHRRDYISWPSGTVRLCHRIPILVSTSDGEHDEIVSDGSPHGAGTLSIASMDEPSEAISPNGAKSSAVDGAPRGGAPEREEPGETTEINQDHLGGFESAPDTRRIVQPPENRLATRLGASRIALPA